MRREDFATEGKGSRSPYARINFHHEPSSQWMLISGDVQPRCEMNPFEGLSQDVDGFEGIESLLAQMWVTVQVKI